MVRVGEDISEKLDVVPAEFFVQRHIYGKWACRCCPSPPSSAGMTRRLSQGRPRALAHAQGQPHRRPSAASLATARLTLRLPTAAACGRQDGLASRIRTQRSLTSFRNSRWEDWTLAAIPTYRRSGRAVRALSGRTYPFA